MRVGEVWKHKSTGKCVKISKLHTFEDDSIFIDFEVEGEENGWSADSEFLKTYVKVYK